jgi:uncharacterized protein YjgD (DUF1641 family)
MSFISTDMLMAKVTEQLLNNGLDYEVTLGVSGSTVRLLDGMTNAIIATSNAETVEEALMTVLAQAASRVTGDVRSSVM